MLDDDKRTALHWAAANGHLDVVNYFLRFPDIKINNQDEGGWTALMSSSSAGKLGVVNTLLDHKADANLVNEKNQLAIHFHKGRVEILKALAEYTNDLSAKDDYGNTPLHNAAIANSIEAAEFLLSKDCFINTMNYYQNTPLHLACELGNKAIILYFLQNNADIHIKNDDGKTPLDLMDKKLEKEIRLEFHI